MKPRAFLTRARRVIDAIDARLERQTFAKGADEPHLVSLVGAFHRAAGGLEGDLDKPTTSRATVCAMVRVLRRLVTSHAIMVRRASTRAAR